MLFINFSNIKLDAFKKTLKKVLTPIKRYSKIKS